MTELFDIEIERKEIETIAEKKFDKQIGKQTEKTTIRLTSLELKDRVTGEAVKTEDGSILYLQNDILALIEVLNNIEISKYNQIFWDSYLSITNILKEVYSSKGYELENRDIEFNNEEIKFLKILLQTMELKQGFSLTAFHLRTWKSLNGQLDNDNIN